MIILDLEWNSSYSKRRKGYINEIIEFGAVKVDENLIVTDRFSSFVKPQVGKRMNSVISNLTNIKYEYLKDGGTFMQVVRRFRKWAAEDVIMTWGTSDILTLIDNCRYFSGDMHVPFLSDYCDLQAYSEMRLKHGGEQLGLSTAAEQLGLDIGGVELHRALDDSELTLEILRSIYDKNEIQKFRQKCDDEFYRRITFKTSYISNLRHPLVKRQHMKFVCPKCGSACDRLSPWQAKNKSFRAEFKCKKCGHRFIGRLILKEKYEGIIVNQKTFPVPVIEKPREAKPEKLGNMSLEIAQNGVGLLKFAAFERIGGVIHAFSTRIGGVSKDDFAAMNLGFGRGDNRENVTRNYELFAEALGADKESFVTGAQDHHINIRRVGAAERGLGIWRDYDMKSVDGLCTNEPGVLLTIYCADCVPLYFIDEQKRAIGLAHAGWKGTAANMAQAMVKKMKAEFGSNAADLKVAIGPSICKECFEVDEPVAKIFMELPEAAKFVEDTHDGKFHIDLWECNRQFLLAAGCLSENIYVGNVCSMCESDLIFSHRRTRGRRGSNAAVLGLK